MDALIRPAGVADMDAVQAIYAAHVLEGLATFEEVPPDTAEMARRFAEVTDLGLPWLVAEAGGRLLGYAYAGRYRARSAYRFSLEDSIYLDPVAQGQGLGTRLLQRLLAECETAGARQMLAVIGDSGNAGSIGVHRRCGFEHVGIFRDVGLKFGRWVDTVLMQRALGPGGRTLP
ncbi:MAG: GNAT family N-acetyltransferase [Amaricoccus sp.]|uniref:GNAT family N-acetyltransferase n=1 Tax=Amaricoccus sp. TaxID=1872485 RepID=UPI0039E3CE72